MKIAVDIDGVLTNETSGIAYKDRTPNLENISKVKELKEQGHKILLFTARYKRDRKITIKWLKQYDVPYDQLIMGKLKYDYIWDDKYFQQILEKK